MFYASVNNDVPIFDITELPPFLPAAEPPPPPGNSNHMKCAESYYQSKPFNQGVKIIFLLEF